MIVREKDKFSVDLIDRNTGDIVRKTLSNHCINFSKWQKVYFLDGSGPFVVKSNIPYQVDEDYFVDFTDGRTVNIKELKKNKEIDIKEGNVYYFIDTQDTKRKTFVDYRGDLPKDLRVFATHYFAIEDKNIRNHFKTLIYEHHKVKQRQQDLDNKLSSQQVQSQLGN